jgi:hypothetical protein
MQVNGQRKLGEKAAAKVDSGAERCSQRPGCVRVFLQADDISLNDKRSMWHEISTTAFIDMSLKYMTVTR